MATLWIMVGLPASGKTTQAVQKGIPIVSRDKIRPYMTPTTGKTVFDYEGEKTVTAIQRGLVKAYLEGGLDVVIDDTNLRSKYVREWVKWATALGHEVRFEIMETTLDECLRRNSKRPDSVPDDVITSMASKFTKNGKPTLNYTGIIKDVVETESPIVFKPYVPDESKPKAIIVDLDGTLARNNSGRHWYALDDTYMDDDVDDSVEFMVRAFQERRHKVIFMSGRDERTRAITEKWLSEKAGFPEPLLYMRKAKDGRSDDVVKIELFDAHVRDEYNVVLCIDDRQRVVRAYRSIGLPVWQVAEGDF